MSAPNTSRWSYSTFSNGSDNDDVKLDDGDGEVEEDYDEILAEKPELTPQGVDPRRGWGYRGVHKVSLIDRYYSLVSLRFSLFMGWPQPVERI